MFDVTVQGDVYNGNGVEVTRICADWFDLIASTGNFTLDLFACRLLQAIRNQAISLWKLLTQILLV